MGQHSVNSHFISPILLVEENIKNWAEYSNCNEMTMTKKAKDLVMHLSGKETTVTSYKNANNKCVV